jgi:hypothetical protein
MRNEWQEIRPLPGSRVVVTHINTPKGRAFRSRFARQRQRQKKRRLQEPLYTSK